jgi:hypothetical protein
MSEPIDTAKDLLMVVGSTPPVVLRLPSMVNLPLLASMGGHMHLPLRADPATGKEIGKLPDMGVEETKEAIRHADVAFKSWTKKTGKASCLGSLCRHILT